VKRNLLRTTVFVLLAVCITIGGGTRTVFTETLPVIYVNPELTSCEMGGNFTIDVNIANVTMENSDYGVYCWEFDMSFNKSLLNVTSIEEGPWLKSTGEDTLFMSGIHNYEGWIVAMSVLYAYPETGVVGSGTLANVTFNVLAEGKCSLDIYKTILTSYNGSDVLDVNHTIVDGIFTIPGDMDGNGGVDSKDLYLLAHSYGASVGESDYNLLADLDRDDDVDSDDLDIFAAKYGTYVDP